LALSLDEISLQIGLFPLLCLLQAVDDFILARRHLRVVITV